MGREKALLRVQGEPAIVRTARMLEQAFPPGIVVTQSPQVDGASLWNTIRDIYPGLGPLSGIHAALRHFGQPCFVVACDMPNIHLALVEAMVATWHSLENPRALVPRVDGVWESLHGIYAPELLPDMERLLLSASRVPPLQTLLTEWDAVVFAETQVRALCPDLTCFANWNCPEDIVPTAGA